MRLTLRTLLAYLDDFLEPEDTEDIAKKIEESEFATQLVHRTRDCMRRLRLGVPPVIGRGLASDPNTVAEYLDNTLAGERVPEFEKICLESDVHLAEVASCHQILTLVLGGSVEIAPSMRERMYALASHVDAPPVQSDAVRPVQAALATPSAQTPSRRAKLEVPEYLREPRSRFWPLAATVLVAAFLTFAALAVLNPGDWRERLFALVNEPSEPAAENATTEERQPSDATADDATSGDATAGDREAERALSRGASDEQPAAGPDKAAPDKAAPGKAAPGKAGPDESLVLPAEQGEDPDAPPAPGPDDTLRAKPADAADDVPAVAPDSDMPEPDDRGRAAGLPAETPDEAAPVPLPDTDLAPADATAKSAPGRAETGTESFGRYTSKHEVLLRFDADTGDWKRLPAMSPLVKGDRLLSLPSFRPTITLGSNITVQPDGAALIELVGWTDQGVPIVDFVYGRFLMMTVGRAGNNLQLKFDEGNVQLTFVDAESTAALETRRVLPPGKDPMADPAPLVVDLYASSGLLRVRQGESTSELQSPARKTLFGSSGDSAGGEFPKWVTSEALRDVDRRAAATTEPLLPADDRPLGLKLRELASDRRREVRSLAIRSAFYLDNFEPCVLALNDKDEKNLWTGPDAPYIQELRAAVARSPETAAKVRATLEKKRAADAPALYRMLWGYSADDLLEGADRDLVEALDKDSLDLQVLAFWNLQNVTGLPNFGYHPGETAAKRRQAVKAWQTKLREGKIVPKAALAPPSRSKAGGKAADRSGS
jgi:hypothetical protein